MKKYALRVCAMLALFTLLLCGCAAAKEEGLPEKEEKEIVHALTGKWELIKEKGLLYPAYSITFKKDGTVHSFVSGYTVDGVYTVEKSRIHITYYGAVTKSVRFKYTYENGILRLWDGDHEMEKTCAE